MSAPTRQDSRAFGHLLRPGRQDLLDPPHQRAVVVGLANDFFGGRSSPPVEVAQQDDGGFLGAAGGKPGAELLGRVVVELKVQDDQVRMERLGKFGSAASPCGG